MQRDIVHFIDNKLRGGWSAAELTKHLNKETLRELSQKFERFEPLVRVRILLSLLTLDNEAKTSLSDELKVLFPFKGHFFVIPLNFR